jgi:hypothetical protein
MSVLRDKCRNESTLEETTMMSPLKSMENALFTSSKVSALGQDGLFRLTVQ